MGMEFYASSWTGRGAMPFSPVTVELAAEMARTTMRAMHWPVDETLAGSIAELASKQINREAVFQCIRSGLEPYGRGFGWTPN